jgi:hypothetical protein
MPLKKSAKDQITGKLDQGWLIAIQEEHGGVSGEMAREVIDELLQTGKVKVLFLEWSSDAKSAGNFDTYGVFFRDAVKEMVDAGLTYDAALLALSQGQYFSRLNPNDKHPNLKELTARAIASGVLVAPCDSDPEMVKIEVSKRDGQSVSDLALFSETGLDVRDEATAGKIRNVIRTTGIKTGLLMLWGSNHFSKKGGARQGVDKRLEQELNGIVSKVFVLKDMSKAMQL